MTLQDVFKYFSASASTTTGTMDSKSIPIVSAPTSCENVTLCAPRKSVNQNDPNNAVLVTSVAPNAVVDCPPNHVLIRVEKFGFSTNNITYQALGEHPNFRYFDFHPAPIGCTGVSLDQCLEPNVTPRTHGLTPVWGFGTVLAVGFQSEHVKPGIRVYGYFAPTRYLLVPVLPKDVNRYSFYVDRPYFPEDRRPYNQITICSNDPLYTPTSTGEDLAMLYRPLFWTAFWCEDWLDTVFSYQDTDRLLISSASSKTAFCLAYLARKRRRETGAGKLEIIGLTSRPNQRFTQGLGLYDTVLTYESFLSSPSFQGKTALTQGQRWIYVDVAGNSDLNQQIKSHFASPYTGHVVLHVELGMTNLAPGSGRSGAPGAPKREPVVDTRWGTIPSSLQSPVVFESVSTSKLHPAKTPFFMPTWLETRRKQMSVREMLTKQAAAWEAVMHEAPEWVPIQRVYGAEKVKEAYEQVVKYGIGPETGLVWSLWDGKNDDVIGRKAML